MYYIFYGIFRQWSVPIYVFSIGYISTNTYTCVIIICCLGNILLLLLREIINNHRLILFYFNCFLFTFYQCDTRHFITNDTIAILPCKKTFYSSFARNGDSLFSLIGTLLAFLVGNLIRRMAVTYRLEDKANNDKGLASRVLQQEIKSWLTCEPCLLQGWGAYL